MPFLPKTWSSVGAAARLQLFELRLRGAQDVGVVAAAQPAVARGHHEQCRPAPRRSCVSSSGWSQRRRRPRQVGHQLGELLGVRLRVATARLNAAWNRAVAMSCIVRVILRMLRTALRRLTRTRRFAMVLRLARLDVSLRTLGLEVRGSPRSSFGRPASFGRSPVSRMLLEDLRELVAHVLEQRRLELPHLADRQVVEEALGAGEDRDHLLDDRRSGRYCGCLSSSTMRWPRSSWRWVAVSSSVPSWANASSSRKAARSRRSEPAIFFIALRWALPPTRDTEMPTLIAGRTPAKNRSGSR